MTHDWQQVSWLAGRHLQPPSQDQFDPSGINGRQLAAYSCGGSCGIACRNRRTAFPWLALAGTTNHQTGTGSHPRQQTNPNASVEASSSRPCERRDTKRERNCAHRGGADSRFSIGAEAFFTFLGQG